MLDPDLVPASGKVSKVHDLGTESDLLDAVWRRGFFRVYRGWLFDVIHKSFVLRSLQIKIFLRCYSCVKPSPPQYLMRTNRNKRFDSSAAQQAAVSSQVIPWVENSRRQASFTCIRSVAWRALRCDGCAPTLDASSSKRAVLRTTTPFLHQANHVSRPQDTHEVQLNLRGQNSPKRRVRVQEVRLSSV
jgi:hypothetical protein